MSLIHRYKSNGFNIVLDINSGCIHLVDEVTYEVLPYLEEGLGTEAIAEKHAPAHGVLIIKDPGISNGYQFRHSLLTFSGYLRSRFRCAAPGCIQKKKSARLSSTGSFLCGADHFPTCSLHRFSIIYRML